MIYDLVTYMPTNCFHEMKFPFESDVHAIIGTFWLDYKVEAVIKVLPGNIKLFKQQHYMDCCESNLDNS